LLLNDFCLDIDLFLNSSFKLLSAKYGDRNKSWKLHKDILPLAVNRQFRKNLKIMKKITFLLMAFTILESLSAQYHIPFPPDCTSEWRVNVQ